MKIALTGVSGLLGYDLWSSLKEKHSLYALGMTKPEFISKEEWHNLDITNSELTIKIVERLNPDCLIHAAAISNPDECELNPDLAYSVNALGTRNLALACQRFDTEFLMISSDQIFDGLKSTPYNEFDAPNPVNTYGKTKLVAETYTQTLLRRFYIVRTALLYGRQRPTFIDRLIQSCENGDKVKSATDIINSLTYTMDLAQAISFLIEKHHYGITHIVNEEFCSRYDLAHHIAQLLGARPNFIVEAKRTDLSLKAKRPGFSPLDNYVWNLSRFPKMRSWKNALSNYIDAKYATIH